MLNILFIGRFYPKNILKTISKDTKGKVAFSNHNFEMSLIKGLSKQREVNLRVLTAPMVFSFPHNNRKYFIKPELYEENGYSVRSIGFINIVGYNFFSIICNLTKAIREEIDCFVGNRVIVIVNTPSIVLLKALFKAVDKTTKKLTTILIVPDIPECMLEMYGKKTLKSLLGKHINEESSKLSRKFDKYVYLTEAMNDYYCADRNDYIVMEGLIDEAQNMEDCITIHNLNEKKEIILYSGTLKKIFGILELVEVFEKGNFADTELWICGSGECDKIIEEKARKNPKIKFYGLVDSAQARSLQSQATILVNPRSASGNYTKYSFPSKTIEYLLAGGTVIMNRLPGVPKEYDQYVWYPDSESAEDWIKTISDVIGLEPEKRNQRNKEGRTFILSKKNAVYQCKRIIGFVK